MIAWNRLRDWARSRAAQGSRLARAAWRRPWVQHAALGLAGVMIGLSCPYWPLPVRPVCSTVAGVLERHVVTAVQSGASELTVPKAEGAADAGT